MEHPQVHSSKGVKHRSSRSGQRATVVNEIKNEKIESVGGGGGGGGDVGAGSGGVISDVVNDGAVAMVADGDQNRKTKGIKESTAAVVEQNEPEKTGRLQKGIIGYMDRQLKVQSLSDPPRSPAQRSTRSRSSLDKSPRRKRSKSESRRRRERKIIAAGEMEVRQANETLMRYLKQCSDFNDASLSGDLEIHENIEDRKVQRKTKSQRERKFHHISNRPNERSTPTDLTTVLNDLGADVVPRYGDEIYNPFTPVVSPTEGPPTRIDKMYIQTSSGYRPVDNTYYNKNSMNLNQESNINYITTGTQLACSVQRVWINISNICHGLLGGLALAHLLLIFTTRPYDWVEGSIKHYSAFAEIYANTFYFLAICCIVSIFDRMDITRISLSSNNETIKFRTIVIAIIYAATTILSLSAESIDERLYLSNYNLTVWEEDLETNKILSIWNSLSIARSFGAILGWIFVGLSPGENLLYNHLLEMEKYQINSN